MSVVLGVQLVLTAGFEMVTVIVVLVEQVPLTPADGLTSPTCPAGFSVGTTAAGADLAEEATGVAAEEAVGLTSTAEVGAATLVETAVLLTGIGAYALETAGTALLDKGIWVASTALLVSAGLLLRAVVGLATGVELGFGVAVVVGFSEAPFLTGTMFCFNDSRACVTSKAASC